MSDIEKRCVECGTEVPTISDTPLCSKDCQIDYANRMIRAMSDDNAWCPTCTDEFESVSSVCYHHNKKHSFEIRRHKFCENCDSKFIPSNHDNENKYCSEKCFGEDNRVERVTIECDDCGEQFTVLPCKAEFTRYCSRQCGNRDWTGENNPGWIDGRSYEDSYYGENWETQRKLAIERDFEKCRICSVGREEHKEKVDMDLSVHHKIPLAKFDVAENANYLSNLITLCSSCHRRVENRIQK